MRSKRKKLQDLTRKEFEGLKASGMLWEFYPEAGETWQKKKILKKKLTPKSSVTDIDGYKEAYDLVRTFFPAEYVAHAWMQCKNPLLGGVTPIDMLLAGRKKKLLQFIKHSLEENKR